MAYSAAFTKTAGKPPKRKTNVTRIRTFERLSRVLKEFETDWRDPYPGVNAVTLMDVADPTDRRRQELLPIVIYAVKRKIESGRGDFWDHATLLEMCVLSGDRDGATQAPGDVQKETRHLWQEVTTADNLRLIRESRQKRGEDVEWIRALERSLVDSNVR